MTTLNQLDTLLAEVQRMREEHLRLQEENERLKNASASVPASAPAAVAAPEPSYPVGTKHVWEDMPFYDSENLNKLRRRIVAIQLNDGVIQVKDITSGNDNYDDNNYNFDKKFYPSLAAWKATLPEGEVKSEPNNGLTDLQSRLKKPFPTDEKSDADALYMFCARWSVRNYAYKEKSLAEKHEESKKDFLELQKYVASIKIPQDNDMWYDTLGSKGRINMMKKNYNTIIELNYNKMTMTEKEFNAHNIKVKYHSRQKLYAFVQGERRMIFPSKDHKTYQKSNFMWCNGRKGKTFAELGIDMKPDGTPLLELSYRTKTYNF